MIISYAKKFAMLATWKAASSTLHERLSVHNESPYSRFYDFNPHLNRVVHQHLTCADFAGLPEGRLELCVAAFVRNPYDRAYSGFLQLQRDLKIQPRMAYPADWIRDLVARQLADNQRQLAAADFDFDRWIAALGEDQVYEAGRNSSLPLYPAHYWTHVGGRQAVAHIGRVEDFEADFEAFCERVEIERPIRANHNVSEGETLPGGTYRYTRLMARATIDKINRLFKDDFDLLGYRPV